MKNRFYAFLIHLSLSCVVAVFASLLVFFVWYPAPLQNAVGVTEIFLLLLSVDIIIGPVITFIIYRRGKPSLKFDLTVIAIFQIAALSYGMHAVFKGRPAFVVFSVDRFELTRALDIDQKSAEKAQAEGNSSALTGWSPRWVGAMASKDHQRQQEILFSAALGGPDWAQLPELYVPLAQVKAQMLQRAMPLQELQKLNNNHAQTRALIAQYSGNNSVKWLPLRGKVKDMIVLIDANTANVMELVDIDPWP